MRLCFLSGMYVAISFYPSPLCFDASTNIYLEGMKENTASFYVCKFIKGGEIIVWLILLLQYLLKQHRCARIKIKRGERLLLRIYSRCTYKSRIDVYILSRTNILFTQPYCIIVVFNICNVLIYIYIYHLVNTNTFLIS